MVIVRGWEVLWYELRASVGYYCTARAPKFDIQRLASTVATAVAVSWIVDVGFVSVLILVCHHYDEPVFRFSLRQETEFVHEHKIKWSESRKQAVLRVFIASSAALYTQKVIYDSSVDVISICGQCNLQRLLLYIQLFGGRVDNRE